MNTTQFTMAVYQWIFQKIIPHIAPATWQQQLIAFKNGRSWLENISHIAVTLNKDANGNIDIDDLKSRIDEIFKIDSTFSYPINEPTLEIIGIAPELTIKFDRDDADALIAFLKGNTTTTEVKL